jgi:hypothetical protein
MKKIIVYAQLCQLFILILGFNVFAQTEKKVWLLLPSEQELISNERNENVFRNTLILQIKFILFYNTVILTKYKKIFFT